jgi:hypothetical protein
MSVLFHPRLFAERDFPGYRRLYRRLVERALAMGAWVGPPADYYDLLAHPESDSGSADRESVSADGREGSLGRHRSRLRGSQANDNKVSPGANTDSPE